MTSTSDRPPAPLASDDGDPATAATVLHDPAEEPAAGGSPEAEPAEQAEREAAAEAQAEAEAAEQAAKDAPSCRACSAPLEPGEQFCKRCGMPQPGAPSCPHCGGVADVSRHDEVNYVCAACGAARVVVHQPDVELSGQEQEHLERAEAARRARLGWWIGGAASAMAAAGGLGTTVILFLLFGLSLLAAGLGLAATLPFVLLALGALRRARRRTKDVAHAVDAAWTSAAKDITRQADRPVTAAELSEALKLPERTTERLLAQLTVDEMLQSDVTPEGRLAFEPALRIETPADEAARDQQAELEQQAAEQAAAPAKQRARRS